MTGRAVLVTGAGSGIGRAVALLCAERGARVACLDVDAGTAGTVAVEARAAGAPEAVALAADVSDEAQVAAAVREAADAFGGLDGALVNAGIERNGPAHTLALEDWRRTIDVNLTGAFLTCKHVLATMLDGGGGDGGALVCTSSPSAFVGFAGGGNSAYGASKGGISALVRSLALDYARHGIRVNAVVPGATDTPLLLADVPEDDRAEARQTLERLAAEQVPLRRMADPREIARAAVWLLSDEASYVTGTHLVCDGGLLAKSPNTF